MGGGLIQLVSKGAQDVYLTGNPQITFFKVVYRRYTNFSTELINQTLKGDVKAGRNCKCEISRDGDLIHRIYFDFTLNDPYNYPSNFGNYMFDQVELLIGGQVIDIHPGHWMEVYSRLNYKQSGETHKVSHKMNGYKSEGEVHKYSNYQRMSFAGGVSGNPDKKATVNLGRISIPLQFWFCKNIGLALPLVALQYNEVVVNIKFNSLSDFMNDNNIPIELNPIDACNGELWVEYIYLDTDERKRFAKISHEYLIDQIQYIDHNLINGTNSIDLRYNNSVKELIFACDWDNSKNHGAIPGLGNNNTNVSLEINSQNFFNSDRSLNYFTRNQIFERHIGNPIIQGGGEGNIPYIDINTGNIEIYEDVETNNLFDPVGVYSFALKPSEHQPTGTFNFSIIQDCRLIIKNMCPPISNLSDQLPSNYRETRLLRIYAVNYNILRIISGMGKLAYI
jgi:hypothetical protein